MLRNGWRRRRCCAKAATIGRDGGAASGVGGGSERSANGAEAGAECSGHGVCTVDGSCVCTSGWIGEDCNTGKGNALALVSTCTAEANSIAGEPAVYLIGLSCQPCGRLAVTVANSGDDTDLD